MQDEAAPFQAFEERLQWATPTASRRPRRSAKPAKEDLVTEDNAAPRLAPALANELVTEDSAAMHFAADHCDRLRYCHDTGAWFEWTGTAWRRNRTGRAFHWARELARRLAVAEPDKVRYVSSKTSFAAGVERFARADPTFAVTMDFWDRDPLLLGTPGGTVDLRTGHVLTPDPGKGITRLTAVAPADRADCSRWFAFLEETTGGDAELILFLQQWAGYCLTGEPGNTPWCSSTDRAATARACSSTC
jgi:putative DNA primase/helicase